MLEEIVYVVLKTKCAIKLVQDAKAHCTIKLNTKNINKMV